MKTLVIIPTYNEKENITSLLDEIMKLEENLEALVIDDNSPDGTWKIVENYAKNNSRVHLLKRISERGRGLAEIAGFRYALKNNADHVIVMDADFSHDPGYIPDFLKKIKECDVVLGSRFLPGAGEAGRGFLRRLITRLAGVYIRILLRFKVADPTSGYRCYRREVIQAIDIESLRATDPFILTEVLFRCYKTNFSIGEIPIVFQDRKAGTSKLDWKILAAYLLKIIRLKFSEK